MAIETRVLIIFLVLAGCGMAMALVAVEGGVRDIVGFIEKSGGAKAVEPTVEKTR